jgi:NhaP-type Na+/H+ or K+/H+ antiporter
MVGSLAIIFVLGFVTAWLMKKIQFPVIIGLMTIGVVLGPFSLNWVAPSLELYSADIRMGALMIIILRAGFELRKETLIQTGWIALALAFIPPTAEALVVARASTMLLHFTFNEGLILGVIICAVSPAVLINYMVRFSNEKKGTNKGIPAMLTTSGSINVVVAVVVCTVLIGLYTGNSINVTHTISEIPISIVAGISLGYVIRKLFQQIAISHIVQTIIVLVVSAAMIVAERMLEKIFPFSALLAVMTIGITILSSNNNYSTKIKSNLAAIWIIAEILLFVLVGSGVKIDVAFNSGIFGLLTILAGIIARGIATYTCVVFTNLDQKEKWFVVVAGIPKATVQAAIGAVPLAAMAAAGMNTSAGETILAISVLSIVITAPLGAWAIEWTGKRWLKQE